ncbi:MAG: EcsC family protein [Clostridium argentinense]|uniref:EcsC family protein n=1 Tax=Clostridium faecium TaxID=2762223 RepID=A0ABR8YRQ0_9CLOT|nr:MULTISPECIES: EcsC family protein [Clostridium]MBD8046933.1 EcsC family protein [Clostridium faecium]MBS5822340.1 EcsC family protein [Clostridium argentinense]MDU1348484.1 EcsC family protein [Clostridium argentinense]
MNNYYLNAVKELESWKVKMQKKPSIIDKASKNFQNKFNNMLPEKYNEILTAAIKNMIKVVLLGSEITTPTYYHILSLEEKETLIREKISTYKRTAMIEGAGTGAGGFLMSLTDFPLLLSIKIKFLYDVASIYGFDISNYKERLYILHIFELAFSSQENMNKVFKRMDMWSEYSNSLPSDINYFDWRNFQQQYRDYIDIAKLVQMLPAVGALAGAYVNSKLMTKLGETAINAYRMRLFEKI